MPMLLAVGPYAVVDPILLFNVLRVAKTALKIVSSVKNCFAITRSLKL